MKHVDMRKLPAAAQEERRRQVIGLRQAGQTYDAIAVQVGLSPTGVFDICKRYAERGAAGLKTGPRGPEPGYGRFLDADQEAEARDLIRHHTGCRSRPIASAASSGTGPSATPHSSRLPRPDQ